MQFHYERHKKSPKNVILTIVKSPFTLRFSAGISSRGHVIVIREAPTTSSSESNFTDPESQYHEEDVFNLTITKLESLSLISELPTLQLVHYEPISVDGVIDTDEMPIVKSTVEPENAGSDKGIFSVSRVKKVELSELPLNTTDICSTRKERFLT